MDYSGLTATTLRQINDKGRSVSLVYKNPGIYSPGTDTVVSASTRTVTIKAAFFDYKESVINNSFVRSGEQINNSFIRMGDKRALVAANALDEIPKINDDIIDGDNQYSIVNVKSVAPGDTVILYELQLRG